MQTPNAPVTRLETTTSTAGQPLVMFVVDCPHCGHEHRHGGGARIDTARQHLGHRAAHCAVKSPTNTGYVLTDPAGLLP